MSENASPVEDRTPTGGRGGRRRAASEPAWIRPAELLGRFVTLGAVLYAFGGAALALGRVGFRALAGQRPYARDITSKVSDSIARCWHALPFAAAGVALMIVAAVARRIMRRRAARAAQDTTSPTDGAQSE